MTDTTDGGRDETQRIGQDTTAGITPDGDGDVPMRDPDGGDA
jgi:hypothetical protein